MANSSTIEQDEFSSSIEQQATLAEANRLWALLSNLQTHNAAISEIARAPRSVRDIVDARSAEVAQAFYASPENNT